MVPRATPATTSNRPRSPSNHDWQQWRDRIAEAVGERPVLAGSGATWFVSGERDNALAHVRGEGVAVIVARTVPA